MAQRAEQNHTVRCVIFDADDTLWSTQILYDQAKCKFADILRGDKNSPEGLIARLDAHDAKAVATFGFARTRFGDSMQAVYTALCSESGTKPDQIVRRALQSAADEVFQSAPTVYLDVPSTLQRLGATHRLFLLTKGDETVQRERISRSGLAAYFEQVYILPDKTPESYMQVLTDHGLAPQHAWAVGNSARSDINPALRAGLRAVMIPNTSWVYEAQQLQAGPVKIVHSLSEAANYILETEDRIGAPSSPSKMDSSASSR